MGDHFEGKTAKDHLKAARKKGSSATSEMHGREPSGYFASFIDTIKESAAILAILTTLPLRFFPLAMTLMAGLVLWKIGRSAHLGWSRLERLHRLIEEERYEIQHHRSQEREELKEMYAEKGLSGKLLDEVTDALMADDNRLLKVMLEEELGLTLETFEHPLKQASGALFGTAFSFGLIALANLLIPTWGPVCMSFVVVAAASYGMAYQEKNNILRSVTWNLAILGLTYSASYFVAHTFFL